jgi:hypothetical protein
MRALLAQNHNDVGMVFLPLYIDTNHNDVGVMLILCNGQCPRLFRVYYFRALCAMTEGENAKKPWFLQDGISGPVPVFHIRKFQSQIILQMGRACYQVFLINLQTKHRFVTTNPHTKHAKDIAILQAHENVLHISTPSNSNELNNKSLQS